MQYLAIIGVSLVVYLVVLPLVRKWQSASI